MRTSKLIRFVAGVIAVPLCLAFGQTVNVWPGAAPGSEDWIQVEWIDRSTAQAGAVVFNVVTPTLTAYLPEESRPTGTGVIVAPGGGFTMLMIDKEGNDVARWLQDRGIAAFVLKYRISETPPDTTVAQMISATVGRGGEGRGATPPSQTGGRSADSAPRAMSSASQYGIADGIQALKLVRQRAAEWGVSPDRIGFMGFSAGGLVTSGVLLQEDAAARPDFAALIYGAPFGMEPAIPDDLPPVFMAWAQDDALAAEASARFGASLKAAGYTPELHAYSGGNHGFGMRTLGTTSDHWIEEFYYWLEAQGLTEQTAQEGRGRGAPAARGMPARGRGQTPTTALGQKAVSVFAVADQWPNMPDITGSGPFPATYDMAPGGLQYVVYQPADLAASARTRKLGVYVWGNGACSSDGARARFHLTEIASRGYVVLAPGSILSGPKAPPRPEQPSAAQGRGAGPPDEGATAEKMIAALNWILAENGREGSPYSQLLDADRVAVGGNSCGGLIAMQAALDPRAKALVLQNSGVLSASRNAPASSGMTAMSKEDLAEFHTPVLYINGGPEDIAQPNALDDFERIDHVPVLVADHPGAGHVGLFLEPNGEATKVELDWLAWQFDGDQAAAWTFVGDDCGLCRDFRWVVYRKGIE